MSGEGGLQMGTPHSPSDRLKADGRWRSQGKEALRRAQGERLEAVAGRGGLRVRRAASRHYPRSMMSASTIFHSGPTRDQRARTVNHSGPVYLTS